MIFCPSKGLVDLVHWLRYFCYICETLYPALFQWFVVFASVTPVMLFSLFFSLMSRNARDSENGKVTKYCHKFGEMWRFWQICTSSTMKVSDSTVLPNDTLWKSFCDVALVEDNLEVILPLHDFWKPPLVERVLIKYYYARLHWLVRSSFSTSYNRVLVWSSVFLSHLWSPFPCSLSVICYVCQYRSLDLWFWLFLL